MTSLLCPKCTVPQPMNVSTLKREEAGPDGKRRTILTTSYHCAICFSFVQSEDKIDGTESANDQAA
jgi:hypothetical protein